MDRAEKLSGSKHRLLCENCVPFMLKVKKPLLSDEYSFAFLSQEELRLICHLTGVIGETV